MKNRTELIQNIFNFTTAADHERNPDVVQTPNSNNSYCYNNRLEKNKRPNKRRTKGTNVRAKHNAPFVGRF